MRRFFWIRLMIFLRQSRWGFALIGFWFLDDHFHDVADPVFDLLEESAARAPGPLTVILERDGDYPSMDSLLAQITQAHCALARGRARRTQPAGAVA